LVGNLNLEIASRFKLRGKAKAASLVGCGSVVVLEISVKLIEV
jgi:hypothetical protein